MGAHVGHSQCRVLRTAIATHKMVFGIHRPSAATMGVIKTDAANVYKLLEHVQALTDTSSQAACQTSEKALVAKTRSHLGPGALLSRGLEIRNPKYDPVTMAVKKYLTVEGCTF